MNRPLLITTGIVILLLMVGLWIYLLAYGAPEKPREIFTNLGFLSSGENEVRVIDPYQEENPGVQLALGGSKLQQLTTRAVAGFMFMEEPESTLRYIERGTGHVFEIDLQTGSERQISLTTVPQTTEAVFSPSGETAVLTAYEGYAQISVLGSLENENELTLTSLPDGAYNFAFEDEDSLYFTVDTETESIGYSLHTETLSSTQIMRVPFVSTRTLWGSSVDGTYVFPKPSTKYEGGLYKVENGLTPIGTSGYGLTAAVFANRAIPSSIQDGRYTTSAYIDSEAYAQALVMLPEKCVSDPQLSEGVWCAAPLTAMSVGYVEDWYKGTIINKDYLWFTNLEDGSSSMAADFTELGGRSIDVDGITISANGSLLLFRNKIDGALWLYRI